MPAHATSPEQLRHCTADRYSDARWTEGRRLCRVLTETAEQPGSGCQGAGRSGGGWMGWDVDSELSPCKGGQVKRRSIAPFDLACAQVLKWMVVCAVRRVKCRQAAPVRVGRVSRGRLPIYLTAVFDVAALGLTAVQFGGHCGLLRACHGFALYCCVIVPVPCTRSVTALSAGRCSGEGGLWSAPHDCSGRLFQ